MKTGRWKMFLPLYSSPSLFLFFSFHSSSLSLPTSPHKLPLSFSNTILTSNYFFIKKCTIQNCQECLCLCCLGHLSWYILLSIDSSTFLQNQEHFFTIFILITNKNLLSITFNSSFLNGKSSNTTCFYLSTIYIFCSENMDSLVDKSKYLELKV